MRRPWDFWKGMLCAQTFIYLLYMLYGRYTSMLRWRDQADKQRIICVFLSRTVYYSYLQSRIISVCLAINNECHGPCLRSHFSLPVSHTSPLRLKILVHVFFLDRYGNIGIKVLYSNVGIDLFGFPPLQSRIGKISFAIMVPIYWSLA